MYQKLKTHFVGIGGIGMSGIAEVLLNLGYPVSGSDLKRSQITTRLKRLGAEVHIGHKAVHMEEADVVVISSAVPTDNPEVVAARESKVPVIQRAEMLAELMRLVKYGVAVAGTHGKTTTTSLIASIFQVARMDPTLVIGGKVKGLRSNARLGRGDFMVVEADESDGSFLKLLPTIAVVTNMDAEHLDHYKTFENYREAFQKFCEKLPFYGVAILCGEHEEVRHLSKSITKRVIQYGFSRKHDWNAQNIEFDGPMTHFDLHCFDDWQAQVSLNLPGRHNVLNALAAIAVSFEAGIELRTISRGLKSFKGVGRRLEVLLRKRDVTVIDDYGHHPTEVKATLQAIRRAYAGRLVVVFQPHRYTRTRDLFEDFLRSFDLADEIYIMDIYAAGESPIRGISGKKLVESLKKYKAGHVRHLPQTANGMAQVVKALKPGDVVLTLGAGDITKWARQLVKKIK